MPPIFLTAQWRHLAMINFEIDPDVLLPLVPAGTELDYFHGRTFVSLVGFRFLDTRLKGWPIPWHRQFEEVNLRFYLRREAGGELRRGVAFIKEIAPRAAVCTVARWVYGENYVTLPMRHEIRQSNEQASASYAWKFRGRWNEMLVRGQGQPQPAVPGSEEEFIIEHYWGYTRRSERKTLEYHVAHPPWSVWSDSESKMDVDVGQLYGPEFEEAMRQTPSSCLLADGSEIAVHAGEKLDLASNLAVPLGGS